MFVSIASTAADMHMQARDTSKENEEQEVSLLQPVD